MSRHQIDDSAWVLRLSGLTRDGTAEPVSRDQIVRRERGQGDTHFPCSTYHYLSNCRIGNQLMPNLLHLESMYVIDHTYTRKRTRFSYVCFIDPGFLS